MTNTKEFFICNDVPKCSKVGNLKEGKKIAGLSRDYAFYKANNQKFASKETDILFESTHYTFHDYHLSSDKEIAQITIDVREGRLHDIKIYRFTTDIDMKWLILVAALNRNKMGMITNKMFLKKLIKKQIH